MWPETVFVLGPSDKVDGPVGTDLSTNWPTHLVTWVNFEIRQIYSQHSPSDAALVYDAWMAVWHRLYAAAKQPLKESKFKINSIEYFPHDIYNAVWAILGYTENQSPKALALADYYFTKHAKRK